MTKSSWRYDLIMLWRQWLYDFKTSSSWRLWRHYDFLTLWRHHVMTSWRYDVIMTLWHHHDDMTSSWLFDVTMALWRHRGVIVTSLWRHSDVTITSLHHCDVIITLWRHQVMTSWAKVFLYVGYWPPSPPPLPYSIKELLSGAKNFPLSTASYMNHLDVQPMWVCHSLLHSHISFLNTYL